MNEVTSPTMDIQEEAVAYMRYSSDNQNETSIEYQTAKIEQYCDEHNLKLVEKYIDRAHTGTMDRREAFLKMMHDVRGKRTWKTILIYDRSRFVRNLRDAVYYKCLLEDHNVNLISVTQPFDDSPEGFLLSAMTDVINDYYSRNNGKVTHDGLSVKARKAGHCGGLPPLGYDLDENANLIINEEEAETVRKIFDLFELNYSYSQIVDLLNAENRLTKKKKPFCKGSLSSILSQEKYTGVYIWNKAKAKNSAHRRNSHAQKPLEQQIRIQGACPQIISPEQFNRVQAKMSSRTLSRNGAKAKHHYMLNGLGVLKCAKCGSLMTGTFRTSHGQPYRSYACPNHKAGECDTKELPAKNLEVLVANLLVKSALENHSLKDLSEAMKYDGKYQKLVEKRQAKETTIQNIMDSLEHQRSEALLKRLRTLEMEKKNLDHEIARYKVAVPTLCQEDIPKLRKDLFQFFLHADTPEGRSYMKSVLKSIDADNKNVTVKLTAQ